MTLPADLHEAAQRAARNAGLPFSAVVTDALGSWVRGALVDAWLAEHQADHGAFDEGALQTLAEDAGVPYVAVDGSRNLA